jgi:hypothetical protein
MRESSGSRPFDQLLSMLLRAASFLSVSNPPKGNFVEDDRCVVACLGKEAFSRAMHSITMHLSCLQKFPPTAIMVTNI